MLSLSDVTPQQRLNKTIRSNKTFASLNFILSNDLIGLFQSISFMCQTLLQQKEISWKERCQNYNLIQKASKFAQIKIQSLLDINGIENGTFRPNIASVFSVKDMAMDTIQIFNNHTSSKNLEVVLNVKSTLIVRSDKIRIEQVFVNMLQNAILSSPRGGKIRVSFATEPFNLKQDIISSEYESLNLENKNKLNQRLVISVNDESEANCNFFEVGSFANPAEVESLYKNLKRRPKERNNLMLMNSKKICNSLFGDLSSLPNSQTGNSTYIATFIAESIDHRNATFSNIEVIPLKRYKSFGNIP